VPTTLAVTATTTLNPGYVVFVSGTTGNQIYYVNTGLTYNAVNNTLTGGIAGGTF
jgi:hypothetical protein